MTKIIRESVLESTMHDSSLELTEIFKSITDSLIIEGVDDPGILKMVFMAGGPG